jgi:hypothetical protein
VIDGLAFTDGVISKITIADGYSHFSVSDDFLLDHDGV